MSLYGPPADPSVGSDASEVRVDARLVVRDAFVEEIDEPVELAALVAKDVRESVSVGG